MIHLREYSLRPAIFKVFMLLDFFVIFHIMEFCHPWKM